MNLENDDFITCVKCNRHMIGIGEEIVENWEAVYIYECPSCHTIYRSTIKHLKSMDEKNFREKVEFT